MKNARISPGRLVPALWLALMCAVLACHLRSAPASLDAASQMALGNPSHARTSTLDETNYLIQRPQYALAYSRYDGIPRWVSWHLSASDIGKAGRGAYTADTSLPTGWYVVSPNSDWSAQGYDRGHMCPSGDRTDSDADNAPVFLMTNLLPQAPDNNQGPWEKLESYCRTLAEQGNELYIICGGRGYVRRITEGHVTVPAYTWKVVVVLPEGDNDLSRVTTTTRVIAVDMPNVQGIRDNDWRTYRTTVDAIEANTGLDLLSNVPDAIQNILEARPDAG